MEDTLVFGSHAEAISALKSGTSAALHPEGSDASNRVLARAMQEPGNEVSYAVSLVVFSGYHRHHQAANFCCANQAA